MCTCEIFSQAIDQNSKQNSHTHRSGQAPPSTPGIHCRSIQIEETSNEEQGSRDHSRCKKSAKYRAHCISACAGFARFHKVSADNGRQYSNTTDDQWENDPLKATGNVPERQPQYKSRNDRHFVGFEYIRRHASTVTDVIPHQVRDDSRISRIILRDACLHFTNQVSTHIRCLCKDTATYAHEQRKQSATKTEAKQSIRGGNAKDHKYDRTAQQAKTIGEHTRDGTCAIGNTERITERPFGSGGYAYIGFNCHTHTELAHSQ